MYNFKYGNTKDIEYLKCRDTHISEKVLERKIKDNEVIIIEYDNVIIGWLRFNYFWDNTPFLNLLMIEEEFRGKGIGKKAVMFWEEKMKEMGYNIVMTSSLSDESAQHFYRKLAYRDTGSLILENEALEIIFTKQLK